jgi:hypothetical protein
MRLPGRAAALAAGVLAAVIAAPLASAAPRLPVADRVASQRSTTSQHSTIMCGAHQHLTVVASAGARYVVKNDSYGGGRVCLANRGGRPDFTVTRAPWRERSGGPQAYPFILYGCSWGTCSPGSALPARVRSLHWPAAAWSTFRQDARGKWDAAFDIWFGRRPLTTGQAAGAELMIWLGARRLGSPARRHLAWLAGTWWSFMHWRTCHRGRCWNYLRFWRLRPVAGVRYLPLAPFIRHAERRDLIRPRWWLENIEAGFELWQGGTGLTTRGFWARA